jgi:hypothetical protein
VPKQGWKTFSIRNERLQQLTLIYKEDKNRPSNQEFGGWFDNLLLRYVEHNEALRRYCPFLEFKSTSENMIHLFDHKLNKTIDIYINGKKKELQCENDDRIDCLHIGFCFAIPEVYKVLIENGFKQPKK